MWIWQFKDMVGLVMCKEVIDEEYTFLDMKLVETLKFAHDIYEKVPNDEVVFDFSKMHNFAPLSMLIMRATMCN